MLLSTASDQIVAARDVGPNDPVALIGEIGRAGVASLTAKSERWRPKARVRKRNTTYAFTVDNRLKKNQACTLHIEIITDGDFDSLLKS